MMCILFILGGDFVNCLNVFFLSISSCILKDPLYVCSANNKSRIVLQIVVYSSRPAFLSISYVSSWEIGGLLRFQSSCMRIAGSVGFGLLGTRYNNYVNGYAAERRKESPCFVIVYTSTDKTEL